MKRLLSSVSFLPRYAPTTTPRGISSVSSTMFTTQPRLLPTVEEKTAILLQLHHTPVNLFTLDFIIEFNRVLTALEKEADTDCAAVVLSSELPHVFTAGLDLKRMLKESTDREQYRVFRDAMVDNFLLLQRFTKPLVVVINGYCPGQGSITSLCCDYRVMVRTCAANGKKGTTATVPVRMGLNESQIGLRVPSYVDAILRDTVGVHRAEWVLTTGAMWTAEEAHRLGLVDAVVDSKEEGVKESLEYLEKILQVNPILRRELKAHYRERYTALAPQTEEQRNNESDVRYKEVMQPHIQAALDSFSNRLKAKK